MSMKEKNEAQLTEMEERRFDELKFKYKATKYSDSSPDSHLYKVLKKIDADSQLGESDINFLKKRQLTETLKIVSEMEEKRRFAELKVKYKATECEDTSPANQLYEILKKIDAGSQLRESDINLLKYGQLTETLKIVLQMEEKRKFAELKVKYKATECEDTSPASHLYEVLKKIDAGSQLGDADIKFLREQKLTETLKPMQEKRFAELKVKYKAGKYKDSSPDSHLYKVLEKIDAGSQLGEPDINFLKKRKLTGTIAIGIKKCEKSAASIKYRIEVGEPLSEADVNWLRKNGQTETLEIGIEKYAASLKHKIEVGKQLSEADVNWLRKNGGEDVISFAQDFAKEKEKLARLKKKYDVSESQYKLPSCPLYPILQKLEKGERLEEMDVAWLQENKVEESQPRYSYYSYDGDSYYGERRSQGRKLFSGKIWIAYHKIEATFYEQEYDRTGNKWNLPNASSHWRKADEPRAALKVTENLNFNTIKENKLKSALLTTRGGAFRDLHKLYDAEKCAKKAIEYQPQSHHPYTLMGAICFERGQHAEGERWFDKAIKRGASPRDLDAEMKRVVKNAAPNKRRELVEYLLKKDRARYAWAKSYLKKDNKSKKANN
ncbi:MAG: hypothetical protein AB4352_17265 [Hormoscilla sp.]